jgi:ribosomal protein S14
VDRFVKSTDLEEENRAMSTTTRNTTPAPAAPATHPPRAIVRTCPNCGHHTLIARGQLLMCRSCQQEVWRSAS